MVGGPSVRATPGLYLVSVKALVVLWSRDAVSLTPFVKVLREEAFQLEAAGVVQLVLAGGHAPKRNAETHNRPHGPLSTFRCVGAHSGAGVKPRTPFECLEAGRQLEQLGVLLVPHSVVEELTNSVQLLVAQVAIGTEVEGQ